MSSQTVNESTSSSSSASTTSFVQPSDTRSHFQLVGEFHDVFGHPQRREIYHDCFDVEPKLVPFRLALMREELNEFKDAYNKNDMVEMADALNDLSYVTNGAGQCFGVDLDTLMRDMNIDISTPASLPEIESCESVDVRSTVESSLVELEQHLNSFCLASDARDVKRMCESLARILEATYCLGHKLGFNMEQMFREVHRSNMTKVCSNIEDAEKSVDFYRADTRYTSPSIRFKAGYYVVYDADTSKILKNYKWETPNLKQFM